MMPLPASMVDHCMKIGFMNLETCVSNDTFELSDYLIEAYLGLFDHCSKSPFKDSMWLEDMTFTFSGRYYTLKPSQIITRNFSDAIQFILNTSSSFSYSFLLHNENFFLLNMNPFSLPITSSRETH